MYRPICLFICFIALINCSNTRRYNNSHIKLISAAIGLIERGDIDSLKAMVDTSYIYKLYSEEGFESRIMLAQKRIKRCSLPSPDLYKVTQPLPQTVEYTLEFCRSDGDIIAKDSFDLVFKFFDYKNDGLIGLLDIRNYARPTKRNEPPPGL